MDILIIEDNRLTLNALQFCIQKLGHSVSVAESGEEAMDHLRRQHFHLLISDIMMPGVSGLSLVAEIRIQRGNNTPILMMSTLQDNTLLDMALEAGANDFIAKPFTSGELETKLKRFEQLKITKDEQQS